MRRKGALLRRYRVVEEQTSLGRRWVVLGESLLGDNAWVDVARFTSGRDAAGYVHEIRDRQESLVQSEARRGRM